MRTKAEIDRAIELHKRALAGAGHEDKEIGPLLYEISILEWVLGSDNGFGELVAEMGKDDLQRVH
jgi:hypothetical protein